MRGCPGHYYGTPVTMHLSLFVANDFIPFGEGVGDRVFDNSDDGSIGGPSSIPIVFSQQTHNFFYVSCIVISLYI